jgi:hypothetical protein
MLKVLRSVINNLYYPLQNQGHWESMFIDYEKPHVERLWTTMQIEESKYRVYLHKIHPCARKEAFYHPHPWPSAMMLCSGCYETGLGYGSPQVDGPPPPKFGPIYLNQWSVYQMLSPFEWHYVRPIKNPCITLMVTGSPYTQQAKKEKPKHRSLTKQESTPILEFFQNSENRVKMLEVLDAIDD